MATKPIKEAIKIVGAEIELSADMKIAIRIASTPIKQLSGLMSEI
jgi:uncharacterized membrane protein (UPF0127 family)